MVELGGIRTPSRSGNLELLSCGHKLECPQFDASDFRGWWVKLEQYFEAEGIPDQSKVCIVMLHLEGK